MSDSDPLDAEVAFGRYVLRFSRSLARWPVERGDLERVVHSLIVDPPPGLTAPNAPAAR